MTTAESYAVAALLFACAFLLWLPSAWQAANRKLDTLLADDGCECLPCPGRGNGGHGMTHCAECCFGTGVEADIDCPIHGLDHDAPTPAHDRLALEFMDAALGDER